MVTKKRKKLGEILIERGCINEKQLEEALKEAKQTGIRIGEAIVKLGFARSEDVLSALATQLNIPFVKLKNYKIDPTIIDYIPAKIVHHYKVLPLKQEKGVIHIAMSDPLDMRTIDDIRLLLRQEIEPVIATPEDIEEAIKRYYGIGAETIAQMMDNRSKERSEIDKESQNRNFGVEVIAQEREGVEDISASAEDASVIRLVNQILMEAASLRATDIHIEPFENTLRVRYRIDGLLYEAKMPPHIKKFQSAITSRIKIMANLNIAERRLPQDGRIEVKMNGQEYDLRVSIIPTAYGESIDIRILNRSSILLSLEELGLSKEGLDQLLALIKRPHGIILVTGPTGSGKTTTLYACLNRLNSIDKMIITIEDPIEYELYGINQIQVNPKIDLTFARCLRSILRHDPNIIMVGEIRDLETAEISIRTALTGHLVFSTLHTNDAPGAVTRLLDMGIEPYLVASSVIGMMAQRLVRVICNHCKKEYEPEPEIASLIKINNTPIDWRKTKLYRGTGCEHCRYTGYSGRTAIFEILTTNEKIKSLIMERAPANVIRAAAIETGMIPLRQDGWRKVLAGITTVDEVLRVTQEEEFEEN